MDHDHKKLCSIAAQEASNQTRPLRGEDVVLTQRDSGLLIAQFKTNVYTPASIDLSRSTGSVTINQNTTIVNSNNVNSNNDITVPPSKPNLDWKSIIGVPSAIVAIITLIKLLM